MKCHLHHATGYDREDRPDIPVSYTHLFVVPNPLVGQWATEFYRFFPNANLLVSTAEDFTPKNRNRYISKIATGEYDAVIPVSYTHLDVYKRQYLELAKEVLANA